MADFVLYCDSGADLPVEYMAERGIKCIDLKFQFAGEDTPHVAADMPIREFYARMRAGEVAKTSAVNTGEFLEAFTVELEAGHDLLYLSLSGGISSTSDSAAAAIEQLRAQFPERKIAHVDPLCASTGTGMYVAFAADLRDAGKSFEEIVETLEARKLHLVHWFTVDDLVYLYRGGRVSKAAQVAGTLLNVKPVLHVADDGKLYNMFKAHGRAKSIAELAKKYFETGEDPEHGPYMICHGDCIEDALTLERMIYEKNGVKASIIAYTGAVIGAHSGPGTLALFYWGKSRN